jgi:hypothetical protein
MPGMDTSLNFYSACMGGLISALIMVYALRKNHRDTMNLLESYWKNDIRILKMEIQELTKLSPKTVDKPVSEHKKGMYNKGYNHQRRFKHGD